MMAHGDAAGCNVNTLCYLKTSRNIKKIMLYYLKNNIYPFWVGSYCIGIVFMLIWLIKLHTLPEYFLNNMVIIIIVNFT